MARITRVAKAQPRYETVPVLDADGKPVQTQVFRKDGTPKLTKRGQPIFMRQTVADKSKPKPLLVCDYCREPIEIGTPYKHVTPKSGPYGGYQRNRHEKCPDWAPWDLSSAWWARVAQVTSGFSFDASEATDTSTAEEALSELADGIRGLAEESREAASNIEQGFGHSDLPSYQEAEDRAERLDEWADSMENPDLPEPPEAETEERWYVINAEDDTVALGDEDYGYDSEEDAKQAISDYLKTYPTDVDEFYVEARDYTAEEPSDEQMAEWRDELQSAVDEIVQNEPEL